MPNLPIELADLACGHKGMISHIAFSPDARWLASTSLDSTMRIAEMGRLERARVVSGHSYNITAMAWSPRGTRMATVSDDRHMILWKFPELTELAKFEEHPRGVSRLAWSMDEQQLVTCANDRRIRVFDANDIQAKHMLEGHVSLPRCIVFSPGGRLLASGSESGTIRLWSVPDYQPLVAFFGHRGGVNQAAWLDDERLVSASDDGSVRVWNVPKQQCIQVLTGHDGPVKGLAFSPCGRLMATKSWDQTLRLWRTDHWSTIAVIEEDTSAPFPNLAFAPRGCWLASVGGVDRVVRLWRFDGDMLAKAPANEQLLQFREKEATLLQARGMAELSTTQTKTRKPLRTTSTNNADTLSAAVDLAPKPPSAELPAADLNCAQCNESITASQIQRRQALGFDFINCPVCETRVPLSPVGTQTLSDWAGARKLILAVMFTDIVDSSALANRLGNQGMKEVRHQHFERARHAIRAHHGFEVKTIGDSFMAAFKTVSAGLDCALDVLRDTGHDEVQIRAALHVGPVEVEENDLFGNMVNFCARLMGQAGAAELCVSEETRSHVIQEGAEAHAELGWRPCDQVSFKGFPGTWRVWLIG